MNNGVKSTVIFLLGAAVGAAATWQYFKKKYEQIADEEIASVKEVYSRGKKPLEKEEVESVIEQPEEWRTYTELTKKYTSENEKEGGLNCTKDDMVHIISEDEFGEDRDYDTGSLFWFDDKVLTDDQENIIEDVEAMVGTKTLTLFDDEYVDSVYIKNDRYKFYYEILRDCSTFYEENPKVDE